MNGPLVNQQLKHGKRRSAYQLVDKETKYLFSTETRLDCSQKETGLQRKTKSYISKREYK